MLSRTIWSTCSTKPYEFTQDIKLFNLFLFFFFLFNTQLSSSLVKMVLSDPCIKFHFLPLTVAFIYLFPLKV